MTYKNQQKDKILNPSSADWEALCQRCGRCCYEKFDYRGVIHYTKTACSFLDPVTRLCRVYNNRQQLQPGCVKLTPEVIRSGVLPTSCPYQQRVARDDNNQM